MEYKFCPECGFKNESKNKFGYVYLLTPSGLAEKASLTGRFLQRKLEEYEEMKEENVDQPAKQTEEIVA